MFAANSEVGQYAIASSPVSAITWNSCEKLPPIEPLSAATARNSRPRRVKMRTYASYILRYDSLRPAASLSNEYASFMRNSRPRITPKRGRISSRNFVWI